MRYLGIIALSLLLLTKVTAQEKYWGKVSGQWRTYYPEISGMCWEPATPEKRAVGEY